jgi:hypothetical protein
LWNLSSLCGKKISNRFGEPLFSRLASIRPKPGHAEILSSTIKMQLWCYF